MHSPYDGDSLGEMLGQGVILADTRPTTAIVDKGYRGVEVDGVRILRLDQKRGVTRTLKSMIKRRSAIEPVIWHMKMDGRLDRNPAQGRNGRRAACRDVRGRAQPEHDHCRTAHPSRSDWNRVTLGNDRITRVVIELFRNDYLSFYMIRRLM